MKETIYNIYLIFDKKICSEVRFVTHEHDGNDTAKTNFLKGRVEEDFINARSFTLRQSFTFEQMNAKARLGEAHYLYDELFQMLDAGPSPLWISTPVKDGAVFFNYAQGHNEPTDMQQADLAVGRTGVMEDWLKKYWTERGLELSQLIHDDYFLAIKLTFNAGLYVSAMKLLVSCIDSLSYIEFGDLQGSFVRWLESYADLTPVGITATELWELRNGLLHMTNIHSKKVRLNKIRRISFRIGGAEDHPKTDVDGIYYFDFLTLINVFALAQAKWIETYNFEREKFSAFVERYDETISDSRLAMTQVRVD
jgi:hypothetical protein